MLRLENISMQIEDNEDSREILKDVSLSVGASRFVVITGPNGGGKSTLAKVIMGIQKPSSGRIFFEDEEITQMGVTERAKRGIGFALQQPVRFKGITVRDLLNLAAGGEASERQLCGYLRDVGLCAKEYIDREIGSTLSGGEIKRIEIATAIARKTKLTIFDEPEAGIDLWSFQNLIDVFQNLRQEIRGTVLIISHQERILEIADEIIVIAGGRVVTHGPRENVLPTLLHDEEPCRLCPRKEALV